MLIERVIRWGFGWVRFEAEGGFPERLLNLSARGSVDLWNVRQRGITLSACCPVRQYRKLRRPARRAGMRLRVRERHGAPFFVDKWSGRAGIALGAVIFLIILQLFSQRTWVIEVRGNETVPAEDILAVMEAYGIREGADLSGLDVSTLQLHALRDLPDLAWCVVNLSGSTAYIDVTERIPAPDIVGNGGPSNLKAAREGRIVSIETYTGQSLVKAGDTVVPGMLLVSGVVELADGSTILKRAHAKVLAATQRELVVRVPLNETRSEPTGETILRPYLHLFSLNIPLFTDGPIDSETSLSTREHFAVVSSTRLPIGIVNRQYDVIAPVTINRTPAQAEAEARLLLEELAAGELAGAEISGSDIRGELIDGVYVLTSRYDCIENIVVEDPIYVEENAG